MSLDYNLPVFCSPTEINFGFGKRDMYESKPIQIFNPYNHLIRFKFFTNAPDRWRVENTQGGIRPNNYVTTTVQLREARELKQPVSDCLRIEIYRDSESIAVGKKDILLNVVVSDAQDSGGRTGFVEFAEPSSNPSAHGQLRNKSINNLTRTQPPLPLAPSVHHYPSAWQSSSFYWLALVGLFACLLCLLLPTNGDKQSQHQQQMSLVPAWLRPSHVQHCVASYILGLLTMYFFLQV